MCGIAGLVTNVLLEKRADLEWLLALSASVYELPIGEPAVPVLKESIDCLSQRFDDLMSFSAYLEIVESISVRQSLTQLVDALDRHQGALLTLSSQGRTDLDPVIEGLRDYSWQIKEELIARVDRVCEIFPLDRPTRPQWFVVWGIEQVLQALDRLEVRGRDSAGIAVQLCLDKSGVEDGALLAELSSRQIDSTAGDRAVFVQNSTNGMVASFVFKTANLIGRLGDNCAALRRAIRSDALLWRAAEVCSQLSVLSHTRWASNGAISIANCHPVNASLAGDDPNTPGLGAMFVLNGDVDNYSQLVASVVTGRQHAIDPTITNDAKIIPIIYRWLDSGGAGLTRLRSTMRQLEGAMAVVMIDPSRPAEVLLSQKGSGQGIYATRLSEGWLFASEIYGLASMSRHSYGLCPVVPGGSISRLAGDSDRPELRVVNTGEDIRLSRDQIQIFSRDIYRGKYEYFLQKEIYDAPLSVEKTLRGRYVKRANGVVDFENLSVDLWGGLRKRARQPVMRIIVIGQGTAGVAAVGIAYLIDQALSARRHRKIAVEAIRSSELSASIELEDLSDAILIAVSQSGTTTDTNRAVDLARDRGAFVHAIVNRRNSDLVRKSDSVILTSDGRDVEMSVASTKAFYSQIAAGKLTALCLAEVMNTMDELEIAHEIGQLETLPSRIREVLALEQEIADCACALAPSSRYWAVTGSGANHIAALEIRIKLSELCYKSIPVDFTEDKKHIDLSTEPLTLVIANDLSPGSIGDVVKEVAIFRAHSGKPVVFASRGPEANAFQPYADRVLSLPRIGAALSFVIATAAGHLWGFHAARAIDAGSLRFKAVLASAVEGAQHGSVQAMRKLADEISELVEVAAEGRFDSGLSAAQVATLALGARRLNRLIAEPGGSDLAAEIGLFVPMLKRAFEELSRPIDTIRHQAKTVTVGTTRPSDALSLIVRDALVTIGVSESRMHTQDRQRLSAISMLADAVVWAATYRVIYLDGGAFEIQMDSALPGSPTGYATKAEEPIGLFRRCLKDMKAVVGTIDVDNCVMFPIVDEERGQPEMLCCLALKIAPYATKDQKHAVLTAFDLYNEMLYRFEERHGRAGATLLAEAIAKRSPEQAVFEHVVALSDSGVRRVA